MVQRSVRRAAQGISGSCQGRCCTSREIKDAADSDAVVAIAKKAGFEISREELLKAQSEISEEELKAVAGGGATSCVLVLTMTTLDC